jgi:glutaredoxin
LGEVIDSTKGRRPIECEKCLSANRTIASLMRELDEIKLQKARQEEEYKKEIKSLQEKVKTGGSAKTSENSAM